MIVGYGRFQHNLRGVRRRHSDDEGVNLPENMTKHEKMYKGKIDNGYWKGPTWVIGHQRPT